MIDAIVDDIVNKNVATVRNSLLMVDAVRL